MGCGCKKKTVKDKISGKLVEVEDKGNIFLNSILFLLSLALIPLLLPIIVVILFKHFFIGGNIDMVKMLTMFKKREKVEEEEEINIREVNPDDYVLVGVGDTHLIEDE
jgi:hypothetical protein